MRNILLAVSIIGSVLLATPIRADVTMPGAAIASATIPAYKLVKEKSTLKFIAIQNNAPVEGQFKDFTADIHFDPDQLDKSSIMVEVATASVVTDNDEVTTNVKLPEWLSVNAFPKAIFKTTGKLSRMPGSDNYYADATLELHGKTLPAVLNFQLEHFSSSTAIATGYVTIKRGDFGIGEGEWSRYDVIKNEVRVEFRIVAEKQ